MQRMQPGKEYLNRPATPRCGLVLWKLSFFSFRVQTGRKICTGQEMRGMKKEGAAERVIQPPAAATGRAIQRFVRVAEPLGDPRRAGGRGKPHTCEIEVRSSYRCHGLGTFGRWTGSSSKLRRWKHLLRQMAAAKFHDRKVLIENLQGLGRFWHPEHSWSSPGGIALRIVLGSVCLPFE